MTQDEKLIELIKDRNFLIKIAEAKDVDAVKKLFSYKGISVTDSDIQDIVYGTKKFPHGVKISDDVLDNIVGGKGGGKVIVVNDDNVTVISNPVEPKPKEKDKAVLTVESKGTNLGGFVAGGIFVLIGALTMGLSWADAKKKGWLS